MNLVHLNKYCNGSIRKCTCSLRSDSHPDPTFFFSARQRDVQPWGTKQPEQLVAGWLAGWILAPTRWPYILASRNLA